LKRGTQPQPQPQIREARFTPVDVPDKSALYDRGTSAPMRVEEYIEYATSQFQKRIARIEKARYQTLEELYQVPEAEVALEEL